MVSSQSRGCLISPSTYLACSRFNPRFPPRSAVGRRLQPAPPGSSSQRTYSLLGVFAAVQQDGSPFFRHRRRGDYEKAVRYHVRGTALLLLKRWTVSPRSWQTRHGIILDVGCLCPFRSAAGPWFWLIGWAVLLEQAPRTQDAASIAARNPIGVGTVLLTNDLTGPVVDEALQQGASIIVCYRE